MTETILLPALTDAARDHMHAIYRACTPIRNWHQDDVGPHFSGVRH